MNKNITLHAQERFLERYGIALTNAEADEIVSRIEAKNLPIISSGSLGTTYAITLRGIVTFPLMRDGYVVTFLPKTQATQKGKRDRYPTVARRWGKTNSKVDGREYRRPHASEITALADEGEV